MSENNEKNEEKYTAKDIVKILEERYSDSRQYTYATEVGDSTGLSQTRRIDFCVINHFESSGFAIEGIEIKVSKADLMSEIRNPDKHNIFFDDFNYFSLACPAYILDKKTYDLIPANWGVYTVKDGKIRAKRKPVPLHDEKITNLSKSFVASFIRRISKPEKDDISNKLYKEYRKGYDDGKAHERKIQEAILLSQSGREKDYIESYKELMAILDTRHYRLEEAIPLLRLILDSDICCATRDYLDETMKALTALKDIIDGSKENSKNI